MTAMRSKVVGMLSTGRRLSPFQLGLLFIVAVTLMGTLGLNRGRITAALRSGDTMRIHFDRNYRLMKDLSQVKLNYVPVGVVTGLKQDADGGALVTIKVNHGVLRKLRGEPTAIVRPTTLLGGNYFVDLVPGGTPGTETRDIPRERTRLPVELDQVVQSLQPSALTGAQGAARYLDQTLHAQTQSSLAQLLADAPGTLEPATHVLRAIQGTNPSTDLTHVVSGLERASAVLTRNPGQFDRILANLESTSGVLSDNAGAVASALQQLPSALQSTNAGLQRLDGTLLTLRQTADSARPTVEQLDKTLRHLDPALVEAAPFVAGLRGAMNDLRPVVDELVPVSQEALPILDEVRGPVLDRTNGPIRSLLLSSYHGKGPYASAQTNHPLYQDVAAFASNLDRVSSLFDNNGYLISIEVGFGLGSAGGLPVNGQALMNQFLGLQPQLPLESK